MTNHALTPRPGTRSAFSETKADSVAGISGHGQNSDGHLLLRVSGVVSLMSSKPRSRIAEQVQAYRRRLAAAGGQEVLFKLPKETVVMLDEIKERQGLRNRSQALLQLIEQGRATAQHPRT
jgi:hypothetical protein